MKKKVKGTMSIEATVIIPLALFMICVIFYMLLYYHDKNVLMAISHESASYGSFAEEMNEADLNEYFSTRIQGRLLLFSNVEQEIQVKKDSVEILCTAKEGVMTLRTHCEVKDTNPEQYIRGVRNIKSMGEREE